MGVRGAARGARLRLCLSAERLDDWSREHRAQLDAATQARVALARLLSCHLAPRLAPRYYYYCYYYFTNHHAPALRRRTFDCSSGRNKRKYSPPPPSTTSRRAVGAIVARPPQCEVDDGVVCSAVVVAWWWWVCACGCLCVRCVRVGVCGGVRGRVTYPCLLRVYACLSCPCLCCAWHIFVYVCVCIFVYSR